MAENKKDLPRIYKKGASGKRRRKKNSRVVDKFDRLEAIRNANTK